MLGITPYGNRDTSAAQALAKSDNSNDRFKRDWHELLVNKRKDQIGGVQMGRNENWEEALDEAIRGGLGDVEKGSKGTWT